MNDPSKSDEQALDLLLRWQGGDQSSISELQEVIGGWMRASARKAMGSIPRASEDSEDLVQDTWLKLLTRLRYRPRGVGEFKRLVQRIVRNDVRDRLRRKRDWHSESIFDSRNPLSAYSGAAEKQPSRLPAGITAKTEDSDMVWLALQFLDDEDRHVAVARQIEGKDWAQVGAELQLTPDAARMRWPIVEAKLTLLIHQIRRGRAPDPGNAD